jgi:hypothetical protein
MGVGGGALIIIDTSHLDDAHYDRLFFHEYLMMIQVLEQG